MKRILSTVARLALATLAGAYVSLLAFGATVAMAGGPSPYLRMHAPTTTGPASATDVIIAALIAGAAIALGGLLLVWADRAEKRERQTQMASVQTLPPGRAAGQGQARKAA
jgi:hypothetical protein